MKKKKKARPPVGPWRLDPDLLDELALVFARAAVDKVLSGAGDEKRNTGIQGFSAKIPITKRMAKAEKSVLWNASRYIQEVDNGLPNDRQWVISQALKLLRKAVHEYTGAKAASARAAKKLLSAEHEFKKLAKHAP